MRLMVQQSTPEWLSLRKQKVTATNAAAIMGTCPYNTKYTKWLEKMDLSPSKFVHDAMKEGQRLEPIALSKFIEKTGIHASPAVVLSDERNWQLASLDGLSDDNKTMVEIKCGPQVCELAKKGIIQNHYKDQMQHQMSVLALPMMFFFTFDGHSSNIIEVERDDAYIADMISKEHEFYKCIDNFEPPALSERDYVIRNDEEWNQLAIQYLKAKDLAKIVAEDEEILRQQLIALAGSSNVKGAGVRVAKSLRKGAIEYKAIPELKGLDLEPYRKKPSEYWRIGIE